ncbi:Uncharacterised protein [Serratia liquefaciens]|uniref:hypothetical protein n=1 Tax=Serratia TaxID=613 RepID=UPI001378D9F4|nr:MULTISPECIES: hypothetical protein [Serratia]NCG51162.1 hypothetical protein [Serratia fonticola]UNK29269.1 hypothetical protein MNO11_05840 [Serratia plymuthica]CAI2515612.1 Uncharacterised protein [Serratia liquefaciens]
MNNSIEINKITDGLIAFCLMKGVQPHELVTAIFDNEYTSIETLKKSHHIEVIVSFNEHVEGSSNPVKMKYTYNEKGYLQRIEQKINAKPYKLQWDRQSKIDSILEQLKQALSVNKQESIIEKLQKSIPVELYRTIYPKLQLVS